MGAASWEQQSSRLRDDDDSESAAAWLQAVDTDGTIDVDTNFRMRFNVTVSGMSATFDAQLQYNLASGGWNNVNASSNVVRSTASPNVSDGAATTEQQNEGKTFVAGEFDEGDGLCGSITLATTEETEVEFCVQIRSADVTDAQTLQLRVIDGSTALDTYTNPLTITVNEAAAAAFKQETFRGRDDDGSESAATWKAAENTVWNQLPDENFRVRFLIQETAGAGATESFQLQYRLNGGTWTDVNASSSVVRSNASANLTEGADATEQMAGSGSFVTDNNGIDEVNGLAGSTVYAGSDDAEYEYCAQLRSADTKYGDKIELRLVDSGGAALDSYTNTALMWRDAAAVTLRQVVPFAITLGSAATSVTKTLTGGDVILGVDKVFLMWGFRGDSVTPQAHCIQGRITGTTTIVFDREAHNSEVIEIFCYLCEFTDGVRVERGVIADTDFDGGTGGQFTVNLANIFDDTKAFHFQSLIGAGAGATFDQDDLYESWLSTSGGVVSISAQTADTGTADHDLAWEVIQYAGCSVRRGSDTLTGAEDSQTASFSAVDLAKTFCHISIRASGPGADVGRGRLRARLTSTTVITYDRDHNGTLVIAGLRWEVVEFTDDVTVQEVLETFASADGQEDDNTLSAVSALTKAAVTASFTGSGGQSAYASDDNRLDSTFTAELTTTTNLQTKRGATNAVSDVAFYVIDFGASGGATTKTITGSLEAALQKQRSLTASAGATLQIGRTRTADANAALAALRTRSAGIEAVLSAVRGLDAGLEAALRDTLARQLGLNAGVAAGKTGEAAIDSALARAGTATAGTDAALRKGQVATALADAALQIERERQAGLTAALALARAGVANLEAALRRVETRSAGLDAALRAARGAVTALDAGFAREITVAAALQAAVRATMTAAAGLDASITEIGVSTATVSLAAALQAAQSTVNALDAGLAREMTVAAALQAAVRATMTTAAGLDASITEVGLRTTIVSLTAALRATVIAGAAIDAALEFARETSAAADAALAGTMLLGAGLDANLGTSLDSPFAPAGTRTFGHGEDRNQVITAGDRTFGHGEDRDQVITVGGRTFVVPAGNRKH